MNKLSFVLGAALAVACGGQTFEASPGGAAGAGQAGAQQGGRGGAGGQAGGAGASGAGASGAAGSPSCACASDAACGPGKNCAQGVCKEKVSGRCWDDDDCGAGGTCKGANICPCNAACNVEDSPGSCKGTATGEWSLCAKPGECLLAASTCCGVCSTPTAADLDAVNYKKVQAHFEDVCPSPQPCPDCAGSSNPALSAMCKNNECQVVDVTKHPVSACTSDADCALHAANQCCNCQKLDASQYVAIAADQVQAYELEVCGAGLGPCTDKCAAQLPSELAAKCGEDGHCKVTKKAAPCPSTPPQGGPCPELDQLCEYGQQLAPGCRTRVACTQAGWSTAPAACPAPVVPGVDGCPKAVADAGGSCTQNEAVCDLGGGASCVCTACAGGPCMGTPRWTCAGAATQPCPAIAPNLGQACKTDGLTCTYGASCTSTFMKRRCAAGVWRDEQVPCPL